MGMSLQPTRPKPTSIDELLDMDAAEFRRVDDYLYRGDLSPKRLIRHMIRLLDDELEWQGEDDSMSLRGLWYSGVKSALQRAFPERWEDPEFDSNRRYSQYLSDVLSEMVKDGEITYRDLNILDDSRQRSFAWSGSLEDDKIVFVEKDAAYRRLEPITEVFEFTLVSGSGWQATALIEDMRNHLEAGQSYSLYVLTDFDPTGYAIVEDFAARCSSLDIPIQSVSRLGIEPEQVSARVREQERFEVPNNGDSDQKWLDEHGIDGKFGLEIEAIGARGEGGEPLRRIVVEALEDDLRLRERDEREVREATARIPQRAASSVAANITSDLEDALMALACKKMAELPGVRSLEPTGFGTVEYAIDNDALDYSHEWMPQPQGEDFYVRRAIENKTMGLRPSTSRQRDRLADELREAIDSGEIDVAELLGLTE